MHGGFALWWKKKKRERREPDTLFAGRQSQIGGVWRRDRSGLIDDDEPSLRWPELKVKSGRLARYNLSNPIKKIS
jgi:hypothetical protein